MVRGHGLHLFLTVLFLCVPAFSVSLCLEAPDAYDMTLKATESLSSDFPGQH